MQQPEHVPVQHRSDPTARRSEPQHVPDLHRLARAERPDDVRRRADAHDVRQRRRRLDAELRRATAAASTSSGRPTARTGHVFAGQTDDPFFLDLRVFDLLYGGEPVGGRHRQPGRLQRAQHRDPGAEELAAERRARSSASGRRPAVRRRRRGRPGSETSTGNFVQVSRLGMPLVNEVVLPVGQKDKWNGSRPADDAPVRQLRDRPGSAEAAPGWSTAFRRPPRRATTSCRCS